MRLALKIIGTKERHTFIGTFNRSGIKGHGKKTLLFTNIKNENGKYLCNHLWFNKTKGFSDLKLHKGDVVSFVGRVKPYVKGYCNGTIDDPHELDYLIIYPRQVKVIKRGAKQKNKKQIKKRVQYRFSHHFKKRKDIKRYEKKTQENWK